MLPNENPTAAQIDAVRELRAWLMSQGVGAAVKGHRDFYATSCPGDRLYRLVKDGTFAKPPSSPDTEDDVAAEDLWQHELPVPFGKPDNKEWQAGNILVNTAKWVYELRQAIGDLEAKLDAMKARLDEQQKP